MILTIASQEASSLPPLSAYAQDLASTTSIASSIAAALARRRANAGRNVLLICQKPADKQARQHAHESEESAWLATEMKAGARVRKLAMEEIASELSTAKDLYHDVVIDMPRLQHGDSLYVLAATGLAVFEIQVSSWNPDRQKRLVQRISAARSWNPGLPVLVMVDDMDSLAAHSIISKLSERVPNIRFIHQHAMPQQGQANNDASLTALYQAIYRC
ncbi:hypothetical protein [Undibacterium terreum]|uniref:Uncharacterized protein n=1 Tax=Undibacterium terreum TaxID=1224302 RepID=A0A916XRW7_9BURK|nr:hypothetical protein [Undibacterium terreum]GGC94124.1 hypothetical protein GCM10011396_46810 [Undibacterium terreum]